MKNRSTPKKIRSRCEQVDSILGSLSWDVASLNLVTRMLGGLEGGENEGLGPMHVTADDETRQNYRIKVKW